jgi:hypothetical protein
MIATVTDDQAKENIAANVINILAEMGRSRYWLADQCGRAESTIQSVCHAISCCNAATLKTIASALGVTTDELLRPPAPGSLGVRSLKRKKSGRSAKKAG